jgi:hypothetical protein
MNCTQKWTYVGATYQYSSLLRMIVMCTMKNLPLSSEKPTGAVIFASFASNIKDEGHSQSQCSG